MPKRLENENALRNALREPLAEAVRYVMDKLLESNKDMIDKFVYGAYAPMDYMRTREFQNAWSTITDKSNLGPFVEGEMFYDGESKLSETSAVVSPNHLPQHTGFNDENVRSYLAEIIYEGYANNPNSTIHGDGAWAKPRNAFEKLADYVGPKRMRDWMQEGLRHAGLQIKTFANVALNKESIK